MFDYNNKKFDKNGRLRRDAFVKRYYVPGKPTEESDDTKIRYAVIKEIEIRVSEGEELDKVAEEIANRKEIIENFSYFVKNGINRPLSEIFKSWYNSKIKNKEKDDTVKNKFI